jgi:hypothetical protein
MGGWEGPKAAQILREITIISEGVRIFDLLCINLLHHSWSFKWNSKITDADSTTPFR